MSSTPKTTVMDCNLGKPSGTGWRRDGFVRRQFAGKVGPARHTEMKPDQDWGSVWPAPRTFHPAVVPLPVRQGIVQVKNQVNTSLSSSSFSILSWILKFTPFSFLPPCLPFLPFFFCIQTAYCNIII